MAKQTNPTKTANPHNKSKSAGGQGPARISGATRMVQPGSQATGSVRKTK